MDTTSIISLFFGITAFIVFNAVFEVRFFEGTGRFFLGLLDTLAEHLGRYNTKRYLERIKKSGSSSGRKMCTPSTTGWSKA